MAEVTLTIEGMSCSHCVATVKQAIDELDGISVAEVQVGSARVEFDDSKTDREAIALAVQNAGYKVSG